MYTSNAILIQHLKQQPRLGAKQKPNAQQTAQNLNAMGVSANAVTETLKNFNSTIETLKTALPPVNEILNNLGARFNNLNSIVIEAQNNIASLSAGLNVTVGMTQKMNEALLQYTKTVSYFEIRNSKLNESFKMSSIQAAKVGQTIRKVGADIGVGDEKLFKYTATLNSLTGGLIANTKTLGDHGESLLQTQAYLQNNLGLTEDAAQSFELYARGMGQTGAAAVESLNAMTQAMADKTGMDATQLQAQIIEDITNMGADLQAQYGRVPGQLEKATMKARLLGTTLEQLNSTGQNMLNIESSIGTELEYQQLTGRRLLDNQGKSLTNEYRMATLKGDATKQADLMQQFLEQEGDTLENNMLARKQAAQLFGMSEADLMRQKQQAELVNELGIQELMKKAEGEADAIAEAMKAEGFSADKISEVLKASDTRTTEQRMADSLDNIEMALVKQVGDKIQVGGGVGEIRKQLELDGRILGKDGIAQTYVNSIQSSTKALGELSIAQQSYAAALQPVNTALGIFEGMLNVGSDTIELLKKPITMVNLPSDKSLSVTEVEKSAAGGFITGPGTGTSDSIPARLSDGEYVINAAATRKYRPLLDKINKNPAKMAAGGGPIMSTGRMETLLAAILTAIKSNNFDYGTKKL